MLYYVRPPRGSITRSVKGRRKTVETRVMLVQHITRQAIRKNALARARKVFTDRFSTDERAGVC
jgi:hypothetical protein